MSFTASSLLISSAFLMILTTAMPPPLPTGPGCSDEIVSFSPCLPFVSSPPNNFTDTPPTLCCDFFNTIVNSGNGSCLCYVVRDTMILGFPLDESRVFALSWMCAVGNETVNLESVCQGSPQLPPLGNTANPDISKPSGSGPGSARPPSMELQPEFPESSVRPLGVIPPSTDEHSTLTGRSVHGSYAAKQSGRKNSWILFGVVVIEVMISEFY